jgi:hypothetical protein
LPAEKQEQRSKYLQCMHAGYNEWLLSVSLGQVLSVLSLLSLLFPLDSSSIVNNKTL